VVEHAPRRKGAGGRRRTGGHDGDDFRLSNR
jgi:hypothetical protein